jgi:hypothetical protein
MAIRFTVFHCYYEAPKLIEYDATREKQFNGHCMTVGKLFT